MDPKDKTTVQNSPLAGVHKVYRALKQASESPRNAEGNVLVELPDEFAPRTANIDLVADQGKAVMSAARQVFDRLESLIGAVYGTELGEFARTNSMRPNSELSAKMQETRDCVHQALAPNVFAGRLLAHYDSLPSFLQAAVWPIPTDAMESIGHFVPNPGSRVNLTSPEAAKMLRLRSFTESFKDALIGIRKGMARGPNKDDQYGILLPGDLRPRTYVEGMPLIWELARQATDDANGVAVPLAELCRLVVRMELAELIRTRNLYADANMLSTIRTTGMAITTFLEHIWNGTASIGTAPMLVDVIGSSL